MKKVLGAAAVLGLSSIAALANPPLVEAEPNNTYPTANFTPKFTYPFGGVARDGHIAPGDVDFISFDFVAGDYITAAIYDWTALPLDGLNNDGNEVIDNDSFMGVFAPGGALADIDDDAGPGFLSAIHFYAPTSGTYAFAISGFGDGGFVGNHGENYDYKFVVGVNPIPEPASLALLGLGAMLLRRR
ncbi:hypothetical protein RAS1_37130 [Phycisphaerae bacterium RAS1]|nr:hypothetical protein RAS1_37130 [Phycisphaerae bacterium RAS1]